MMKTALREIGLLKPLNSSGHSVRLLDVEHDDNYVYIVMEYIDTNLKIHIGAEPVDPSNIRTILYKLCQGVAYCHSLGVLHRDLKPENLLIEENEGTVTLKIAYLGLGRAFTLPDTPYTDEIVTLWYRAPEVLLGSFVKFTGVDIWAIGCIFSEMSSGQPLFPGGSEIQQLGRIFSLLGTPTEEEWPEVTNRLRVWGNEYPRCEPLNLTSVVPLLGPDGVDLLSKMLKYNPADRISAKAALSHPYFAIFHDNNTPFELNREDTCDHFQVAYELLVNMSFQVVSYEQALIQTEFAKFREGVFAKIISISGDLVFDPLTCAIAMYYFNVLLSKIGPSTLAKLGVVDLWSAACYRLALKVVQKCHICFPELELLCALKPDWNYYEVYLVKTLDWNLCPATLYILFMYLKENLRLRFGYNDIKQYLSEEDSSGDDSIGGDELSGGSVSSDALSDATGRNTEGDQKKVQRFSDSLIMRVLSDARFLQFQVHDIAAALVFVLCEITQSSAVLVYRLTDKEKVKECEAVLRSLIFG